jgi:hypothetical protein
VNFKPIARALPRLFQNSFFFSSCCEFAEL